MGKNLRHSDVMTCGEYIIHILKPFVLITRAKEVRQCTRLYSYIWFQENLVLKNLHYWSTYNILVHRRHDTLLQNISVLTWARLAQMVEHQTFNLRVRGSSPLSGFFFLQHFCLLNLYLVNMNFMRYSQEQIIKTVDWNTIFFSRMV